jgi:hypothetical protein
MSQPTFVSSSGPSKNRFLKLETNTNVKPTTTTTTTTTSSSCANNPFFSLPSYVTDFHLETQPADIPTNVEIKKDLAPKEDDFPPLSISSKSARTRSVPGIVAVTNTGPGLLYKNALLTKLGQNEYEEQVRIRNDMQKELERKEERMRQLQLASKRERAVADLVSDFHNMPYEYDDNIEDDIDRRRPDYD